MTVVEVVRPSYRIVLCIHHLHLNNSVMYVAVVVPS